MSISAPNTDTHPSKRRRLANTSPPSGLTKPFKCPLKGSLKHPIITKQGYNDTRTELSPSNPPSAVNQTLTIPHTSRNLTLAPNLDLPTLQKHHTHLLLTRRQLRQSLDTARQALQITTAKTSSDSTFLISKWRLASRAAAEQVYCDASERVRGMGGMAEWRDRSRRERRAGVEDWGGREGRGDGDGDGEEGNGRRDQREGMEERDGQAVEQMEGDDDESFTMDMMLVSLHIDLNLIGYDKENQQWREE